VTADRESLIAAAEAAIGCRLPDDYRAYLLAGQMPRSDEPGVALDYDTTEDAARVVYLDTYHRFADVGGGEDGPDLTARYRDTRGTMPAELLPIAEVLVVGYVCLGIRGEHFGKVYFWKHNAGNGPGDWDTVNEMFSTFAEYLTWLRQKAGVDGED
jgi:hypothetical protein